MRRGAKIRELIGPYFHATFRNIANPKQHMIDKRCANKQPWATTVPWEDISEHNRTHEAPNHAEEKSDRDRGTFERDELLPGRIRATNKENGVARKRIYCAYKTDAERNSATLSQQCADAPTLAMYTFRIAKEAGPHGQPGRTHRRICRAKMQKARNHKTGPEVWSDIITRNPGQEEDARLTYILTTSPHTNTP